jgi:hypothetical protein
MTKYMGAALTPVGNDEWKPLPGFAGIEQLVLAGHLDETARRGHRTRLVRFAPGVQTDRALTHDYHEEAYLVSGDLCGSGEAASAGSVNAPAYTYRVPGTPHGPFKSEHGCVLVEIHFYAEA